MLYYNTRVERYNTNGLLLYTMRALESRLPRRISKPVRQEITGWENHIITSFKIYRPNKTSS
jgi:hypothetical protein